MVCVHHICLVVAVLALAVIGAVWLLHVRRGRGRGPEAFTSPAPSGTPTFTEYKLCTAQNVCASRQGIDPKLCQIPEVGGTPCCEYNAANRSCQSKFGNPVAAPTSS